MAAAGGEASRLPLIFVLLNPLLLREAVAPSTKSPSAQDHRVSALDAMAAHADGGRLRLRPCSRHPRRNQCLRSVGSLLLLRRHHPEHRQRPGDSWDPCCRTLRLKSGY